MLFRSEGFSIEDKNAVWSDFIPEKSKIECVKSYIHHKVKLLFDPPLGSAVIDSMERTIKELEWRLMVAVDPVQTSDGEEEIQNE